MIFRHLHDLQYHMLHHELYIKVFPDFFLCVCMHVQHLQKQGLFSQQVLGSADIHFGKMI